MDYEIRTATPDDHPAVMALLEASLGWVPDSEHEAFFRWKHEQNPFGPSLALVAVQDGQVIGFRTLLRWEYERDGVVVRAGRAVDTATHPDHQGKGIFTKLSLDAVARAEAEGVGFVFNTPNSQSRPGYLKMGWRLVGRIPIAFRVRSIGAASKLVRSRVAAERWSLPCSAGAPAIDVFGDHDAVERLLASIAHGPGLRTRRTGPYLSWRYGLDSLAYRAEVVGDSVSAGAVVFRTRRRGSAVELAVVETLAPAGRERAVAKAVRSVLKASAADYAVRVGRAGNGFVPLPNQGPIFTWRRVCETEMPPMDAWALTLGDVELF